MRTTTRSNQSGSTLIVALLICLAGTMGLMSLITLVGNRGQYVEDSRLAIQRRVALQNAKALVRSHLYGGAIVQDTGDAVTLPDLEEWGGSASIGSISTPPLESFQELSYFNRVSPSEGQGFTVDVPVTFTIPTQAGDAVYQYDFQLRSRSPLLSGYPFLLYKPVINPSAKANIYGNIIVEGHSVIHHQNLTPPLDLITETYDALPLMETVEGLGGGLGLDPIDPTTDPEDSILGIEALSDLSGELQAPRNFGSITTSTGLLSGAPALVEFTSMLNSETPANALITKLESIGGAIQVDGAHAMSLSGVTVEGEDGIGNGNLTIDLRQHTLSQVYIHQNVKSLRLIGNSAPEADDLPLVFVVYHKADSLVESYPLQEIILDGNNNRRVLFGARRVGGQGTVNVVSQASSWRMLVTMENLPIHINPVAGSELSLVGGIRTESSVGTQAGTRLRIVPEEAPALLERLDPREVWVESHAK